MNKVTLPSGATVTLKDPTTIKYKDRKRVVRASESETGELSKALALGDALIAVMIEDWSFDLIIPSIKIESLDELTPGDYDALVKATQKASEYLFPAVQDNDENKANPDSPLDNSNA
jgi:hypothetical protein